MHGPPFFEALGDRTTQGRYPSRPFSDAKRVKDATGIPTPEIDNDADY
jgi:hypothetical protein